MLKNIFKKWLFHNNISIHQGCYNRNDGKVHYYLLTPAKPQGDIVIFLHGTGNDSGFLVEGQFSELLKNNYTIFTFDLDGHGKYSTTKLNLDTIDDLAAPAIAFCKNRIKNGSEKIHLIGLSLGGLLAMYARNQYYKEIGHTICIAPPFQLKIGLKVITNEILTVLDKHVWDYGRKWGFQSLIPAIGPVGRRRYPIRMVQEQGDQAGFSYVTMIKQYVQYQQENSFFLRPETVENLTLIFGKNDYIANIKDAQKWVKRDLNISMFEIARANHFDITINPKTTQLIIDVLSKK